MARGIRVTSRRGVQLVALAFAAVLLINAYFLVTTGYPWPLTGCSPQLSEPHALFLAGVRVALALGFIVAALRNPGGPDIKDPVLVGMALALASSLALHGGAYTLVTGVARFGRTPCLEVGTPLSYGIGVLALGIGAVALYAAVMVLWSRQED